MRPQGRPAYVLCMVVLLLLGGSPFQSLQAQDRGAPRFGLVATADSVEMENGDAGRVWSVATPPLDRFQARYGIEADSAWATHLRRGVLRLPDCTAALVSADGLALTTDRCVRRHRPSGEVDAAHVATERSAEQELPSLYADRLLKASDVTAEVEAARSDTDGSIPEAMRRVRERRQEGAAEGTTVEVVGSAGGSQFTAYTYRRYDDVRLVFRPEPSVSAFGGSASAFTYPRHGLDVALIRVYTEEGSPLAPNHFFEPSTQGARPGDAVFSMGHPEATQREESADQLAVRRDLILPVQYDLLNVWTGALEAYRDTATSSPDPTLIDAQRALKKTEVRLAALQNDALMTRLRRRDDEFQQALQRDPALREQFGGVLDSLTAIQQQKRSLASAYRAFGPLLTDAYSSTVLRRALLAHQAAEASGAARERLLQQIEATPAQPAPVDAALLAEHVEALRTHLQADTASGRALLQGASPSERARTLVNNTVFAGSIDREEEGASVPTDDPALAFVDAFADQYESFREEWKSLAETERRLTARLSRARHQLRERVVLPAADRAPRLTDGRVRGYPYNGTMAPPFTTFYGLYGESQSFNGKGAWALPDQWETPTASVDRSVPLTLAASTDPVVASDGAPLLNQYLELVGVAGDSNIQGVAGAYFFLPERMRSVGTDLRGLRESLSSVYEAEALIQELFGPPSSPDDPSSR